MQANQTMHAQRSEKIAAFSFGCIFLATIIAIALLHPHPSAFEYTVFRITIALAAAGFGAMLPGFLHMRFKNLLRAGGAFALFAVVYFFAPAAIPVEAPILEPEPTSDAKIPVDNWLSLIDRGQYRDAYMSMAEGFRSRYPYSQFEELVSREHSQLGKARNRQFISATPYESPPGAPKGFYRQYVYRVSFENETQPVYEIIWTAAEKNEWRVSGFNSLVKMQNGQFVPYEPK